MFSEAEFRYLERARVGRLATADAQACPHVVPVCFALVDAEADNDTWIATPIDEKPQRADPTDLRRVRDVAENDRVALVADEYVEDWTRLGWVQVRGRARRLDPDDAGHEVGVAALRASYDQYADHDLESRPLLRIDPGSVVSWGRLDATG